MASPLCWWLILTQLLIQLLQPGTSAQDTEDSKSSQARQALEYVERIRNSACAGGSGTTLPVDFDHSVWSHYAEVAVQMANIVTKRLLRTNNTLLSEDDQFLFELVRNNVDSDTPIVGSAIGMEEFVHPNFKLFGPYSYKDHHMVYAHDLAVNYYYLDPSSEWYHVLRLKDWSRAHVTTNIVKYRYNETSHDVSMEVRQPMAQLEEGHWTRPYFDCGGADIWMVTYSAPIFGLINDSIPVFKGVGTIDIELTNIDINQCDFDAGDERQGSSVDVFRGTHQCPPSTKCSPVVGLGFIPGAYICECKDGYYFPETLTGEKYFNGTIIENYISSQANNTAQDVLQLFRCLPCAEGCDLCEDASPCLYSYLAVVRVVILILGVVMVTLAILTSVMVQIFKTRRSIKSASPMFLHFMTAGAALMCLPILVTFQEASDITCTIKFWPQHVGFAFLYGALLLKTWRISVIFKVQSARKVTMTDKLLAQRLLPIVCVVVVYLIIWTVMGRPEPQWRWTTSTDLKFKDCSSTPWEYGAYLGEGVFLLWGCYLCYVVRKAPSHFNESKYITWAIYNNIILGSFILIIRQFIAINQGPDVIYAVDFAYTQVSVTGTLCLIFIPKFHAVKRSAGNVEDYASNKETITGRTVTKPTTATSENVKVCHQGTQTDITQDTMDQLMSAASDT